MTKALRRDPVALYSVLKARRKDLLIARHGAVKSGDRNSAKALSAAMEQIDEALAAVVAHLNEVAAAEEADQAADAMEADQAAEPSAEEEPSDMEPSDEEPSDMEPSADEEVSPEDSATDEVLEEDGPAEEEPSQGSSQSSVAMKATLRREMGDVAADLLDDYATKIQTSVTTFFDNLTKKALDLGAEDPADSSNSLREQLLTEIGRRGLEKVEPTFVEWRAGLIKQLMRDINKTFEVPQEEKPELDLPEGAEEAPAEEAFDEEAPAEEGAPAAEEAPAEEAEEEEVVIEEEAPAEAASAPMKMPASVLASFGNAKPVSFTIHRDMKPGAARSIKLT
jgi:hypothetical protein